MKTWREGVFQISAEPPEMNEIHCTRNSWQGQEEDPETRQCDRLADGTCEKQPKYGQQHDGDIILRTPFFFDFSGFFLNHELNFDYFWLDSPFLNSKPLNLYEPNFHVAGKQYQNSIDVESSDDDDLFGQKPKACAS